jgi:signal transduction histidine kinase
MRIILVVVTGLLVAILVERSAISAGLAVLGLPLTVGTAAIALAVLSLLLAMAQQWRISRLRAQVEDRSRAALALWESLRSAPDGLFAWIEGGEEQCSPRLAVLLGLARGVESEVTDMLEAFAEEDRRRLAIAIDDLRAGGDGFDLELGLADGRRVGVKGVRAAAPDGEPLADLLWVRDVTAEAALVADLDRRLAAVETDAGYLRGMLNALPMPVWLRDDDLSLLAVNRAYAAAVEAPAAPDPSIPDAPAVPSPAAAVAEQIELAAGDWLREARALAAHARAAGAPRSEEFHLVLGGQRRLTAVTEIAFSNGGRLLTAGFALDQTPIEDLKARLDRHIAAHGEVLEHLATAIAIFAPDTRLAFFNTAFEKLWRLSGAWLASHPTYGGVMDALRERRLLPEVADYRAYRDGELKRFTSLIESAETLLHLPDGRTLRRMISAHPHGGLIFTYEDVTDSLAQERLFNTMTAVQRETLDHLYEGLAVWGGDGRLKLFNPAFAGLWGLEPAALADEPHIAEVADRMGPVLSAAVDPAAGSDTPRDRLLGLLVARRPSEGRMERPDGTILDYAAVPLPDGAMLMTWLDVTDTARVERALRERNEALAAADLLKSEFIANVSAELRKPLTTVIGFSEMLSAEFFGGLNDRQREYAAGITEAGQALQALISDILDLAAIEAGKLTLELDAVDIHPLLTAVLSLLRERLREKRLHLTFDCPLEIGWVVADERRLKQVMFNLVGNAIAQTPPDGAVTVEARRDDEALWLTVVDTGPGIGAAERDALFDSFIRGQPDLRASAGLGLGLVKRFVDLHGGRIDIRTAPGEGTAVIVRLPAPTEALATS